MKNKKVLHLITGLNVGGAEKVVFDLSLKMTKEKFETFVIGISSLNFLEEKFKEEGVNVQVLNVERDLKSFFKGFINLLDIIKRNDIKIIHAHMTHALVMAVLVKLTKSNIKIIFTSHSSYVGSSFREKFIFLSKYFRSADIVFSSAMKKKMYKKNAYVIPNGIDTEKYKLNLKKNDVFTFLAIGRLEDVKNHRILIDAAKELSKEFDFQIHIVGEGVLKEEIIAEIGKYKLENYVKLLGYRSDINVVCNQSHVFVLPSLWEGLPISLIEAGASSLPSIVTPVGSIPDLIDEKTGYLASLNDFVNEMRNVYYNYEEAIFKGLALQKKIESEYDLTEVFSKHLKIYKEI